MITFNDLWGVPVHYDRSTPKSYGTVGVRWNFQLERTAFHRLESAFRILLDLLPVSPTHILSAGAYVAKPGYHGRGKAFDLDGLIFTDRTFMANMFPEDPVFYLGIEAALRTQFGTILNWFYNDAHRDHWHMQNDGRDPFSMGSYSDVTFVQAAVNYVWKEPLRIDGVYGPRSRQAVARVLDYLDLKGTLYNLDTWRGFLMGTASKALKG